MDRISNPWKLDGLILQLYLPTKSEGLMTTYIQQQQQHDQDNMQMEPVEQAFFKDLHVLLHKYPEEEKS